MHVRIRNRNEAMCIGVQGREEGAAAFNSIFRAISAQAVRTIWIIRRATYKYMRSSLQNLK